MNVDSMRYFLELSEKGSFYAAAKGLFISPQGLNKAVQSMEDELGVKLVERSRRGITLTEEGRRFRVSAQSMVDSYDGFLDTLFGSNAQRQDADEPLFIHVTYYSSQIASPSQEYVNLLSSSAYLEEPFEKIVKRAETSDGTDLSFVDLHGNTIPKIMSNRNIAFDPVVMTRVGIVCRKESELATRSTLRRREVANMPCALNAQREMAQLLDWLFREEPLTNVRMRVTAPRMLLRYVQAAEGGIALFDSFGFHLSCKDESMPTDGLAFVPLSTPEAQCYVGFLVPKHVRLKPWVIHASTTLGQYLSTYHGDYMAANPLSHP